MMYVISRDRGYREAAAQIGRGRLIPVESLDAFLNLVVSREHQALAISTQKWLMANGGTVSRHISAAFRNAGFYIEDADGSVEDVELETLRGSALLLVEVHDDEAVFGFTCEATFTAVLVYEDPDSGIYDKEDEVMLFTQTRRRWVRRTSEFEAEIRLRFEPAEEQGTEPAEFQGEIEDLVINRGRDFRVSIEDELLEELTDEDAAEHYWYADDLHPGEDDAPWDGEAWDDGEAPRPTF